MSTETVWSPAYVEQLTALWNQGATCSQIARALGSKFTRSAVMGKARRLNLPMRQVNWVHKPKKQNALATAASAAIDPAIGTTNVFLTRGCKFIDGDTGPGMTWRMCGQPGSPWCDEHRRKVFTPKAAKPSETDEEAA